MSKLAAAGANIIYPTNTVLPQHVKPTYLISVGAVMDHTISISLIILACITILLLVSILLIGAFCGYHKWKKRRQAADGSDMIQTHYHNTSQQGELAIRT